MPDAYIILSMNQLTVGSFQITFGATSNEGCMQDLENPSSVKPEHIERWKEEGIVELLGFSDQVVQHYVDGHIVCLSSYREGLFRGLIEVVACGRSVVTIDVLGCRDVIILGQIGLLVLVMNAVAFADVIQFFVESSALCQKMGVVGRVFVESEFSIQNVISQHLDIYHELELVYRDWETI